MLHDELFAKIKLLNERLWENRAQRVNIDEWLSNFSGDFSTAPSERLHALYLLSQFIYFGDQELREMLRALYRDKFRYPLIQQIRQGNGHTLDTVWIEAQFAERLARTRFLGMGNPAESGTHLLYFFRQENRLKKGLFIQPLELFDRPATDTDVTFASPNVERLVFIDDFCASGDQAVMYSKRILRTIRDIESRGGRRIECIYLVLLATMSGIQEVRTKTLFDRADAVFVLDDTYACFSDDSRYFKGAPTTIDRLFARDMSSSYGAVLNPAHPLGYKNAQLLLGFHHNIPDNTLPIIWYAEPDQPTWSPIFRRYQKIYG